MLRIEISTQFDLIRADAILNFILFPVFGKALGLKMKFVSWLCLNKLYLTNYDSHFCDSYCNYKDKIKPKERLIKLK